MRWRVCMSVCAREKQIKGKSTPLCMGVCMSIFFLSFSACISIISFYFLLFSSSFHHPQFSLSHFFINSSLFCLFPPFKPFPGSTFYPWLFVVFLVQLRQMFIIYVIQPIYYCLSFLNQQASICSINTDLLLFLLSPVPFLLPSWQMHEGNHNYMSYFHYINIYTLLRGSHCIFFSNSPILLLFCPQGPHRAHVPHMDTHNMNHCMFTLLHSQNLPLCSQKTHTHTHKKSLP